MRRGSWRRIAATAIVVATGLVAVPQGNATALSSGEGFDTCDALPTSAMRSVTAPRVANVYIGRSDNLSCPQSQLNAGWVSTVTGAGWRLIPTFIGKQAPCTNSSKTVLIGSDPTSDGSTDADLAASRMQALGLAAPNVVYDDMEGYNQNDATCSAAVAAYLDAFISRLHSDGYRVGVYGSTASTVAQLVAAYNNSARQRPDDIWIANPNGQDTTADPAVPASDWVHRRVRQYQFNDTLIPPSGDPSSVSIDDDAVDGDTAAPSADALPPYSVSGTASVGFVRERSSPSTTGTDMMHNDPEGTVLDIVCQVAGGSVAGDPIWDKLADGNYVSDLYTTTPGGTSYAGTFPRCDTAPMARMIAPLDGTQVNAHATIAAKVYIPVAATAVYVYWSTDGGTTMHLAGSTATAGNGVANVNVSVPGGNGAAVKLFSSVVNSANSSSWSVINSPSVHVVAPTVTMAAAPVATVAPAYTFSWTGVDGAARPTAYDVQYERAPWNGGFGAWTSPSGWTGAASTSKALSLAEGYEYCVRVRPYGLFGNVGDWSAPRCIARPLDDRAMTASAGWTRGATSGYYNNTWTSSTAYGAALTRTGAALTDVGVLATMCASCGSVAVYVGNTYTGTISLYAASTHRQQLRTVRAFALRTGATVTLRVATKGKLVQIDGLLILR
ncbi:MAG: DUF1906 domain-containing protein [Frankiaceae bacterium]|nr:DUF1906 domain-containing protein [Frankiaceae bacterium]